VTARCERCRRLLAEFALSDDGRLIVNPDVRQEQELAHIRGLEDALRAASAAIREGVEGAQVAYLEARRRWQRYEDARKAKPKAMAGARAQSPGEVDRALGILGPRTQRRTIQQGLHDHVWFRHESRRGKTCSVPGSGYRQAKLAELVRDALARGDDEVLIT
jgi:hypothetical protein